MPVTISRSLIDRVARHKTRPGAQLPQLPQLLHPTPVSSSRSSPGLSPPYPPPPSPLPPLPQSQHAGRPLPCRLLRYDICTYSFLLVKSCLGNHLSQQYPLLVSLLFLFFLWCSSLLHYTHAPIPRRPLTSPGHSFSLSLTVCRVPSARSCRGSSRPQPLFPVSAQSLHAKT